MAEKKKEEEIHVVARNPKAWHKFRLSDRWEAGLVLQGTEVKSLRLGRATLTEAYAHARRGELWLMGAQIPPYAQASFQNHEETRPRKLLLHRRQIEAIAAHLDGGGAAVVPLALYFKGGVAKVELALGHGKTHADQREDLKKKEAQREVSRELSRRRRGG